MTKYWTSATGRRTVPRRREKKGGVGEKWPRTEERGKGVIITRIIIIIVVVIIIIIIIKFFNKTSRLTL